VATLVVTRLKLQLLGRKKELVQASKRPLSVKRSRLGFLKAVVLLLRSF